LFEDATSQGDGARADVEALDTIPELEQRDQIAPRAAPDHENPILDLQKAIIQSALPGHQARADQLFAATELLPGVDDRSPPVLAQTATTCLQCANCGLVFIDPLPGESELCSLYLDYDVGESDPPFASELAWTRRSRAPVFREILDELVAHGARGRLLDVGCSF